MQEYRGYFFGNMYLNSISHGIQAAHVVSTMALALERKSFQHHEVVKHAFFEWAQSPTKILLNGGDSDTMTKFKALITHFAKALDLPYAWFCEPGLEGCMTSIGVVVPAYIYNINPADIPYEYANVSLDDILVKLDNTPKNMTVQSDVADLMYLLYLVLKSARLAS